MPLFERKRRLAASASDRTVSTTCPTHIIVKWRHAPYGTSENQIQFSQQMQVHEWQHRSINDRAAFNQIAALKSTKSRFLGCPMSHVFISYVREDSESVENIARALRACNVDLWLDRNQIKPGVRWADAIRTAITEGTFYMACFSTAYNARTRSYMNEELTLAIEQLRQRATDQRWFIPVLLDDCEIPQRSIGAGETLRSLQWVRLYEDWNEGIARILSTVQPDAAEVHRLRASLRDASARARIRAADRLGELGPLASIAVDGLLEALEDQNVTVRAAAAEALGKLGIGREAVVQKLLGVLRKGEFYSSATASRSLVRLGAVGVTGLLEAMTFTAYGVA